MAEVPDTPDLELGAEPVEVAATVATSADLAKLHGTLAKTMTNRIASGKATAAEWSAAIKFLDGNGITSNFGNDAELDKLAAKLKEQREKRKAGLSAQQIKDAESRVDRALGVV
jgi:antirestriction protein